MRVDVRNGWADLGKQIDALSDTVRNKVVPRTLNKVVEGARGQMATTISATYNITKREANQNLRTDKASAKAGKFFMEARVYAPSRKKGRGFNVVRFIQGRRIVGGRGKAQLRLQIIRGKGTMIKGAFLANDGKTVFVRTGEGKREMTKGRYAGKMREPIEAKTTVDIPQMFNARRVTREVIAYMNRRAPVVFVQELKFATRTK